MSKFSKIQEKLDHLLSTEEIIAIELKFRESTAGSRSAVTRVVKAHLEANNLDTYDIDVALFSKETSVYNNKIRGPLYGLLFNLQINRGNDYVRSLVSDRKAMKKIKGFFETDFREYSNNLYVRATYNINWAPGTYGEKTVSCYWGGRNAARAMIAKNKGFAFQFFRDQEGKVPFGRCWGWLKPDVGLILWNAYFLEGYTSDKLFPALYVKDSNWLNMYALMLNKSIFNTSVRSIVLKNNGEARGTLYINNGGFLISPAATRINNVDFRWKDEETVVSCNYCRDIIFNENDIVVAAGGILACEGCALKFFDVCNYNHETYVKDQMILGPDNLNYHQGNIGLVKKFCFISESGTYRLKSDSRLVGNNKLDQEIWLPMDDTRVLCSHCKSILIDSGSEYCVSCKFIIELAAHKERDEIFVFGNEGFSWKLKQVSKNRITFTSDNRAKVMSDLTSVSKFRFSSYSSNLEEEIPW